MSKPPNGGELYSGGLSPNSNSLVGASLSVQMTELNLTWKQLAVWCGVGRSTVWKWRCGVLPVPTYVLTILRQQRAMRQLAAMGRRADPIVQVAQPPSNLR